MRAEEPNFSPQFSVAYALLKKGIDPEKLERPHFDALTEQAGRGNDDYQAKRTFAQNAVATWTELRDLGIRDDYGVRSLFEGDARFDLRKEAKSVEADFAAVSGFLAKSSAAQAEKALDMIAGNGRGAMKKAELELADGHGRGDDHFAALAKITTLKTIALEYGDKPGFGEQIKTKANALAAELYTRYQSFEAARDFFWVIQTVVHGNTGETGFEGKAGEAVRKVFASEGSRAQVMDMIGKLSPEERSSMIAALSRGYGSYAHTLELPHAAELARRIWTIDHGDAPFAPSFGSHPVLPKLFALAGQDVTVEVDGGREFTGAVIMVRDHDPDKEGSHPVLGLPGPNPGEMLSISMPIVTKISAKDGGVIFDAGAEGRVAPRVFSPVTDTQREVINQIVGHYVVGDYSVNHETISAIAARVADEVPGAKELLAKTKGLPGYMEHMASGAIVGRYLLGMLDLDLGPNVSGELAMAAYGAVNGDGYKSWGFDRRAFMDSGASLSRAVELTKDRAYGLVELLQNGPVELRKAVIENAIAALPERFEQIQKRGVPVDAETAAPFLQFWKA